MNNAIIILDSHEGHVVRVFTDDPALAVLVADVNVQSEDDPVVGPFDENHMLFDRVVTEDVGWAARRYIDELLSASGSEGPGVDDSFSSTQRIGVLRERDARTVTTLLVTTVFGRWDEASSRLKRSGFTLTAENTVEVESKSVEKAFFVCWRLAVEGIIAGFSVDAEEIR